MKDFYKGMLALPVAAASVGVASLAVMGGWVAAESWAERRWTRIGDPVVSEHRGMPYTQMNGRDNAAALVALAPTVRRFKLGFGSQLVFTRGTQRVDRARHRTMARQIYDTYTETHAGATE